MIVCKFGGSSISNAENIIKVSDVLQSKLETDNITCVFSAIGKTTDNIIKCAETALNDIKECTRIFEHIEKYHNDIVYNLFDVHSQLIILEKIDTIFLEMEHICQGIHYIKDFSNKTKDRLISYGETLSSIIIFNYLYNKLPYTKIKLLDTKKYIKTDSNFGNAKPDFNKTESLINTIYNQCSDTKLFVVTGFIASIMMIMLLH